MQLKMDMAALAALFPEGSEARVELQNAVVAEFVRKNIKPGAMGADFQKVLVGEARNLADQIRRGIADAKHSVFKEVGVAIPRDEWSGVTLTDQQKTAIRNAAHTAISDEAKATFQKYIDERVEKLGPQIEREVDRRVGEAIEKEVTRRIAARLAELSSSV